MRKKLDYEQEGIDMPFEHTISYLVTMVNLGYGVKVKTTRGGYEWNPTNGYELITPEADYNIKSLREEREKENDKIISIEFYLKEEGI